MAPPRGVPKPNPLTGREEEIMPQVLDLMAQGQNVSEICRDNGWPESTIRLWAHSPRWKPEYAAARETLGEIQGEWVVTAARAATTERDSTAIQGLRVYVDALKWSAARIARPVYGDNVDVTSKGEKVVGVIALPPERESVDAGTEPAARVGDIEQE